MLGAVTRLDPSGFAPFAASLRATGFRGRLGLVVGGYAARGRRELDALADFTVVVDDRYGLPRHLEALVPRLRSLRERRDPRYATAFTAAALAGTERGSQARWEGLEFALEGLQSLRYGLYLELLRDLGADADHVLLSDVRDVLFQADPFATPPAPLELFLEEPALTPAGEALNRGWLADLYGPEEAGALAGLTVSCSGTVAGSREGVVDYLQEMRSAIAWRRRPMGSRDQAVHNRLLRRGSFTDATLVANGTGRVLTMGEMPAVERDGAGQVRNADGSVPPVLHQYDRHPELAADLLARLGSAG